jgi:hypothetical protein
MNRYSRAKLSKMKQEHSVSKLYYWHKSEEYFQFMKNKIEDEVTIIAKYTLLFISILF